VQLVAEVDFLTFIVTRKIPLFRFIVQPISIHLILDSSWNEGCFADIARRKSSVDRKFEIVRFNRAVCYPLGFFTMALANIGDVMGRSWEAELHRQRA
jgi:hypothetical protein